jgi:pyrimidine operon attenuation protein/uracil phosphoribosyltransferase
MEKQVILNAKHLELTLKRLSHELIESHNDFSDTVLVGLQPRGIHVVSRLKEILEEILGKKIVCGNLDITFYRDDFRRRERPLIPSITNIDFSIENKKVVLIDDVLYTGRTLRAALDALHAFGRPQRTELLVLIDRRFRRELPIQPDYVGRHVDALDTEKVRLDWSPQGELESVSLIQEKSAQ